MDWFEGIENSGRKETVVDDAKMVQPVIKQEKSSAEELHDESGLRPHLVPILA